MNALLTHYWSGLSPALRRYYRASVLPCLSFLLLAMLHEWVTRDTGLSLPWRFAAALAPMLGLAWIFAAYLRFLHDCDELERRIELAAVAWSAGIVLHGLLACAFLLDANLVDWSAKRVATWLGMLLLGSAASIRAVLHRRYA